MIYGVMDGVIWVGLAWEMHWVYDKYAYRRLIYVQEELTRAMTCP